MTNPRYAPELALRLNGAPAPAELRASLTSVQLQSSLGAADRVELSLANEGLRWLDHPLFKLDTELVLALGYAPDPLEQLFVGEIVGHSATFPSSGLFASLFVDGSDVASTTTSPPITTARTTALMRPIRLLSGLRCDPGVTFT